MILRIRLYQQDGVPVVCHSLPDSESVHSTMLDESLSTEMRLRVMASILL